MWDDDFSASRVLMTIGKDLQKPAGDLLNLFLYYMNIMIFWNLEMVLNVKGVVIATIGSITLQEVLLQKKAVLEGLYGKSDRSDVEAINLEGGAGV